MTDTVRSLIRTWAPMAIGAVVAYLATLGIDLDADTQTGLIVALTGVLQAVYYAVARAIEPHLPDWVTRVLLGSATAPEYRADEVAR